MAFSGVKKLVGLFHLLLLILIPCILSAQTVTNYSSSSTGSLSNAFEQSQEPEALKYEAELSYRTDQFIDIFDPWHFVELDLKRETAIGSVIGRIRYANRFSRNGMQYEIDAYPSIADGLYAYLNAGISDASIFPDYRFGFNLYKSLPNSFEADAGLRYLNFGDSDVTVLTGALSKYYGNYYFTARTYITPKNTGTSSSFSLQARKYFRSAEHYINLRAGYGSAQEELRFEELTQRLNSWSISARIMWELSAKTQIGGSIGYDSEEFENFTRKRLSIESSFAFRF